MGRMRVLWCLLSLAWPGAHADDAAQGKEHFLRNCIGCHAFACNKEGPRLGGLFGRRAASAEGFDAYSEGLKKHDVFWSEETLNDFFTDPGRFVVGNMAQYGKIDDPVLRRQVIAFLKTEDPTIDLCF